MHTVKAALEEAIATIERVDAHVLMAHVLGVNRAWLAANPMRVLTETEDARVDMLVAQRALGRPVAYLVEKREFYGRDFVVGPDVLIPRPETETLVEAALARLATHVSSPMPRPSCLDLGTGSGALAVTLACERPNAALTDGSRDGLDSIRAIVAGASEHLNARGWLLFEHGYDQAQQAEALLTAAGFREIVSIPDLAGIPRVAGGKIT